MLNLQLFIPKKAQSHRQEKVSSEIRYFVAQMFIRADWYPVKSKTTGEYMKLLGLVSIVSVNVSPDLKRATVYISNSQPEHEKNNLEFLKSQRVLVRKYIAQNVQLRNAPEINFRVDAEFDDRTRLLTKIDEISAQLREKKD